MSLLLLTVGAASRLLFNTLFREIKTAQIPKSSLERSNITTILDDGCGLHLGDKPSDLSKERQLTLFLLHGVVRLEQSKLDVMYRFVEQLTSVVRLLPDENGGCFDFGCG